MLSSLANIFLGMLYVYSIYLAIRLVFGENRNPIRTLGWMVVLLFIPVFGLILFTVFGQSVRQDSKIWRLSIRSGKVEAAPLDEHKFIDNISSGINASGNYTSVQNVVGLIRLLLANGKSLLYPDNEVQILKEPKQTFDSMFYDLEQAKDHIHIEFYIISNDSVGNRLREILVRKAREGLTVRVIYDYWGSTIDKAYKKSMREAGVRFHSFFPPKFPFLLRHVNYRNHRKIVIIDGKIGYTGGVNVADRYLIGNELGVWRDTMARFRGSAVHGLQETFLGDWYFIDHMKHQKLRYFPVPEVFNRNNNYVQIADSGPDMMHKAILQAMTYLITTARKYVYIQTPYFLPPVELENALRMSALRGVDIRVLIPEGSDASMAQAGNASYIESMLEAGVRVYIYKGGFLHSKAIVADNYISSVGTSNMDFRSYEQNFEINSFIYEAETAMHLRDNFISDLSVAEEVTEESWSKRSRLQKARESFSRLFSPAM